VKDVAVFFDTFTGKQSDFPIFNRYIISFWIIAIDCFYFVTFHCQIAIHLGRISSRETNHTIESQWVRWSSLCFIVIMQQLIIWLKLQKVIFLTQLWEINSTSKLSSVLMRMPSANSWTLWRSRMQREIDTTITGSTPSDYDGLCFAITLNASSFCQHANKHG